MKHKQQLSLFLGGLSLLTAVFLPWTIHSSIFGIDTIIWGYEDNGIITGGIGFLFIIGLIFRKGKPKRSDFTAGRILTIFTGLLLLYNIADVIYSALNYTESGATTDFGSGLYLSVIGTMLFFISGIFSVSNLPDTKPINPQDIDSVTNSP